MVEMRQRIDRGDAEREIEETIQVSLFCLVVASILTRQGMCDIAKDRAKKLQARI
jgi:hypothetical protein